MMSDIFAQAKCVLRSWIVIVTDILLVFSAAEETAAVPIADIDLEQMDG